MSFEEAIQKVKDTLKKEGFAILTEFWMHAIIHLLHKRHD